jgi:hypothetical protein
LGLLAASISATVLAPARVFLSAYFWRVGRRVVDSAMVLGVMGWRHYLLERLPISQICDRLLLDRRSLRREFGLLGGFEAARFGFEVGGQRPRSRRAVSLWAPACSRAGTVAAVEGGFEG